MVIAWVIFIMWTMIIERVCYLRTEHPHRVREAIAKLVARPDHGTWAFEVIRTGVISRLGQRLRSGIPVIQTLAAICPLLGLLGTVTGMIVIFDVMAAMGNSSPRAVASGVAQATMTTMAGMVGALSGVFPATFLAREAAHQINTLHNDHEFVLERPMSRLPPLRWGTRLPVALGLAAVVTIALLYGMQRLIETGEEALTDDTKFLFADFVRIDRDETIEKKKLKPDKPPPPDIKPDNTVLPDTSEVDNTGIQVNLSNRGDLSAGLSFEVAGISGYELQDGDYLPLVKITPIYPRRAAARGMEGWVVVMFTITTTGTIEDVVVVESSHALFERSAVQAAYKFKYRPRIVNGLPVAVTGVKHLLRFVIEQ